MKNDLEIQNWQEIDIKTIKFISILFNSDQNYEIDMKFIKLKIQHNWKLSI